MARKMANTTKKKLASSAVLVVIVLAIVGGLFHVYGDFIKSSFHAWMERSNQILQMRSYCPDPHLSKDPAKAVK